jgi:hypothetical protein
MSLLRDKKLAYCIVAPIVLSLLATHSVAATDKPGTKFGLSISLPRGSTVYIPVTENDEIIGVIPLENDQISGIRFQSYPYKDGVRVVVTALLRSKGPGLEGADYAEVKSWAGEPVDTYVGKQGDMFQLSALSKFALPSLALTITAAAPLMPGSKAPVCSANHMVGAPDTGTCIGMAGLCTCCRAGRPSGKVALYRR